MKGLRKYLTPFAPDQSGAVSVLYELGGMLVICDAGGCTGNVCGFDEPRWFETRSAVFSAGLRDMDAVLLTPGCSDPLYRRAARVSMGTVFQIPWTYITFDTLGLAHNKADHGIWPEFGMEQLHSMGFRTASMALRNDTIDIHDPELKQIDRLAVILGTEGEGLKTETIDSSDYTVKIPMYHGVDSLNVAAASAVAFWELGRRS